jgi:hypothetical protein
VCPVQYDITKEHIIVLIDADKAMLETLTEGVSGCVDTRDVLTVSN